MIASTFQLCPTRYISILRISYYQHRVYYSIDFLYQFRFFDASRNKFKWIKSFWFESTHAVPSNSIYIGFSLFLIYATCILFNRCPLLISFFLKHQNSIWNECILFCLNQLIRFCLIFFISYFNLPHISFEHTIRSLFFVYFARLDAIRFDLK